MGCDSKDHAGHSYAPKAPGTNVISGLGTCWEAAIWTADALGVAYQETREH